MTAVGPTSLARLDPASLEAKWSKLWDVMGIYRWDPSRPREETVVVDTPPPTVSGSLHLGHVFSYTHTDVNVRFLRMAGKNIMYPMGWDDNGLPTERRVQNVFNIDCNPALPYDPSWVPVKNQDKDAKRQEVSRQNFIQACDLLTREDEEVFANLWKRLGLSVEWRQEYNTIGAHCRAVSQRSFLDLAEKGQVYQVESPTIWDVTFKTAVAQAELEDRPRPGLFHDIQFNVKGGGTFTISTTRPELLASCIAIVAHPEDQRYSGLFGKEALTPLFKVPVPILPSEHAQPEKGTGIMMVCTFGDSADVAWWKTSGLPLRATVGRDGRLQPVEFSKEPFLSEDPEAANTAYAQLVGKTTLQARKAIATLLSQPGTGIGDGTALVGTPRPIEHPVKFYEKGDKPVEFVSSRQWYVKILEHQSQLLEQGRKIQWHPEHMLSRYEHWVTGLNQDWCISRQRFFGVPFPIWYRLDENGVANYSAPIFASLDQLPVDPLSQAPAGFTEEQRGKPGGFIGDPDVMDTWATSSLTPQIVSQWGSDKTRHMKLFPMDVRPQSHEIIRTWAFYTIVKAWLHEQEIPWKHVAVSGWILDPDRKKMSKSTGNVVTPEAFLAKYGSDAVRYWAARAKFGVDTAFDEKVFEIGRKLSNKVFNASKFVLGQLSREDGESQPLLSEIINPLDRAWLSSLRAATSQARESLERFEHAGALNITERLFWDFCDNYLELVKQRGYSGDSEDKRSAHATLSYTLSAFLRAFAPFMPYVTEEVWSVVPWNAEKRSIHVESWPSASELQSVEVPDLSLAYDLSVNILAQVRQAKGDAKKSTRTPVKELKIEATQADLEVISTILSDVERTVACMPGAVTLVPKPEMRIGEPVCAVVLGEDVPRKK
jgi:valyl-tRNA synthetase